jgi:hypothetical protein
MRLTPPPRPPQGGGARKSHPWQAVGRRGGVPAGLYPGLRARRSGRLVAPAMGVLAAGAGAVAGTTTRRLEPATTGACAPACAPACAERGRDPKKRTSGLPTGWRLLRQRPSL